eukprot:7682115-Karenia_brevis.AAC.1
MGTVKGRVDTMNGTLHEVKKSQTSGFDHIATLLRNRGASHGPGSACGAIGHGGAAPAAGDLHTPPTCIRRWCRRCGSGCWLA